VVENNARCSGDNTHLIDFTPIAGDVTLDGVLGVEDLKCAGYGKPLVNESRLQIGEPDSVPFLAK
jgi:hypothetical protein